MYPNDSRINPEESEEDAARRAANGPQRGSPSRTTSPRRTTAELEGTPTPRGHVDANGQGLRSADIPPPGPTSPDRGPPSTTVLQQRGSPVGNPRRRRVIRPPRREPARPDGEPAWFSAEHNAFLEAQNGWAPGTALNLWQTMLAEAADRAVAEYSEPPPPTYDAIVPQDARDLPSPRARQRAAQAAHAARQRSPTPDVLRHTLDGRITRQRARNGRQGSPPRNDYDYYRHNPIREDDPYASGGLMRTRFRTETTLERRRHARQEEGTEVRRRAPPARAPVRQPRVQGLQDLAGWLAANASQIPRFRPPPAVMGFPAEIRDLEAYGREAEGQMGDGPLLMPSERNGLRARVPYISDFHPPVPAGDNTVLAVRRARGRDSVQGPPRPGTFRFIFEETWRDLRAGRYPDLGRAGTRERLEEDHLMDFVAARALSAFRRGRAEGRLQWQEDPNLSAQQVLERDERTDGFWRERDIQIIAHQQNPEPFESEDNVEEPEDDIEERERDIQRTEATLELMRGNLDRARQVRRLQRENARVQADIREAQEEVAEHLAEITRLAGMDPEAMNNLTVEGLLGRIAEQSGASSVEHHAEIGTANVPDWRDREADMANGTIFRDLTTTMLGVSTSARERAEATGATVMADEAASIERRFREVQEAPTREEAIRIIEREMNELRASTANRENAPNGPSDTGSTLTPGLQVDDMEVEPATTPSPRGTGRRSSALPTPVVSSPSRQEFESHTETGRNEARTRSNQLSPPQTSPLVNMTRPSSHERRSPSPGNSPSASRTRAGTRRRRGDSESTPHGRRRSSEEPTRQP